MVRQIRPAMALSLWFVACLPTAAQQRPTQPPIWADQPSIADFVKKEDAKLAAAQATLAALSKVQGPHTIDNTVEPFDEAFRELDDAVSLAKLVREVHPDSTFRDKGNEYVSKAESARQWLLLNRTLYDALAAADLSKTDEATKYYVERRLKMSRWAGVDRSDAERSKLNALQEKLSAARTSFIHNIEEDNRTLSVKPMELQGLPADFFDSHKPGQDGMIRLAVETDLYTVLKFATSEDGRRRMYQTA